MASLQLNRHKKLTPHDYAHCLLMLDSPKDAYRIFKQFIELYGAGATTYHLYAQALFNSYQYHEALDNFHINYQDQSCPRTLMCLENTKKQIDSQKKLTSLKRKYRDDNLHQQTLPQAEPQLSGHSTRFQAQQ